ncbi:hypothetical protein BO99DRAFT_439794 [Aspergillus violaceofuscus CBS 115571]|uniref:Uncharacterized protein n=1 Tax=Aspergillus violaceofuscus (strain CBS 115571) TaxID=1450538 RepID=A0A2V5HI74_ASPV1|nr:hypothetical protein BO99DRAFT_439794 [Aspergillus violaceofuscus CBS 115571]
MSITSYPAKTNSGTVTSYLPLTTAWPSSSGCASIYRLNGPSLVAWDPGYGLDVNSDVVCDAPEVTTWWEQGLLENGGTLPTRVSLGPFTCPEAFSTMKSSVKDAFSTLEMCCPSQYYIGDGNTALIDGNCESDVSSGMVLTYASTPSGEDTPWRIATTTLTRSWTVGAIAVVGWNICYDAVTLTSPATTTVASITTAPELPSSITSSTDTRTLPTGIKVGIGVGAGLGVLGILALLAALCIFRRRKRQKATTKTVSVLYHEQRPGSGRDWRRTQWPVELDGTRGAAGKGYRSPAELDGSKQLHRKGNMSPVELMG